MANALKDALGRSGGRLAGSSPELKPTAPSEPTPAAAALQTKQLSRRDTAAITVHYPEPVRRQLKVLASEEGRTMDDMVAEALNLLFARYRKGEIAPRKDAK